MSYFPRPGIPCNYRTRKHIFPNIRINHGFAVSDHVDYWDKLYHIYQDTRISETQLHHYKPVNDNKTVFYA